LTIADLKFLEGKQPSIFIYNWGSRAISFRVLVLTREGLERLPYVSNADRSRSTTEFRLSQLPMSVIVEALTDPVRRGELYVRVHVEFADIKSILLCQGYVYSGHELMWPPGTDEDMLSGPPLLRSVTGTNPAAGVEISETVPTNARWRLIALLVQLVTDATVANRRPHFIVDDGVNTLFEVETGTDQAASQTIRYNFANTGYRVAVAAQNIAYLTAPFYLPLFQGWRVRTSTVNLQAGDDYGAPQLLVEEWIEE